MIEKTCIGCGRKFKVKKNQPHLWETMDICPKCLHAFKQVKDKEQNIKLPRVANA